MTDDERYVGVVLAPNNNKKQGFGCRLEDKDRRIVRDEESRGMKMGEPYDIPCYVICEENESLSFVIDKLPKEVCYIKVFFNDV